ncbi:hypothetical protein EDB83DRAFT_984922 [Lactarius deliciosus]|nr:hypothetical protein EDB83DRAFT_984922 [Lactarius deliciosus]
MPHFLHSPRSHHATEATQSLRRQAFLSPAAAPTLLPPSSRSIQVTVSPRPRFPSALPRATSETFRRASSTAVSDAPPSRASPLSSANCAPGSESLRGLSRPRLQTRFIPGVGWCVRSGGTHYRIMFQDGVALEVDVDEEMGRAR